MSLGSDKITLPLEEVEIEKGAGSSLGELHVEDCARFGGEEGESELVARHRHSFRSSSLIPASNNLLHPKPTRRANSTNNLNTTVEEESPDWHRKPRIITMETQRTSTPDYITKSVYLGDRYAAYNFEWLLRHGVTHIINIAALTCPCFYPGTFKYLSIEVEDSVSKNITQFFDVCTRFINKAVGHGGKVLVHCEAGRSRSASIVIQYLLTEHGMSLKHAYKFVKRARVVVIPNISFFSQLRIFELERTGGESLPLSVPNYILHNLKLEKKILKERKFKRMLKKFVYPFRANEQAS